MSFDYDVAIVGGGPAGSSTALHLRRCEAVAGDRILVLDKARFPRDKPCAGAISALGLEVLADLGVEVTVPRVPMTGVRVLLGSRVGETAAPMGVCVRRTEFDADLLERAAADGVHVRDGEGLSGLARTAGGFRLKTTAGRELTARFVAACDGAGSPTRKLLGIREADRKGHLYVLDTPTLPGDEAVLRGRVDFDLTVLEDGLAGYYWDFPTTLGGVRQVSRGIYDANLARPDDGTTPTKGQTKAVLARALARRGIDIATVKLRPFSTRPFVPRSPAWVPGVVLVGEACGIDQTTGEGIAQAIDFGRIASRHLARAIRSGDPRFWDYARELVRSTTGRHMIQSAWLARRVYGRIGAPARRYLLRSAFARAAAVDWYRGEALGLLTQLRLALGLAGSIVPGLAAA